MSRHKERCIELLAVQLNTKSWKESVLRGGFPWLPCSSLHTNPAGGFAACQMSSLLPAVNSICTSTVRPLAFLICVVTHYFCFFFLTPPPPSFLLPPLRATPSTHRGSLLNKWPQFIYMVIPGRRWPRDARHIMYHHNAYALWLIRLLI